MGVQVREGTAAVKQSAGGQTILPIEECLKLLLEGKDSAGFEERNGVPCRPSASPINPNINLFYVVETAHKRRSTGTSVKYNGFTRSQIWWSSDARYQGWGVVCRKMSLKPRNSNSSGDAGRHGLAGYWLFLANIQCDNQHQAKESGSLDEHCDYSRYVVQGVPSLVQFWFFDGKEKPVKFLTRSSRCPPSAAASRTSLKRQASSCASGCTKRSRSTSEGSASWTWESRQFHSDSFEALDQIVADPDFCKDTSASAGIATPFLTDVFKLACEILGDAEFQQWYSLFAELLASDDVANNIEAAFARKDQRLTSDFMVPATSSFVPGLPTAKAKICGGFSTGFIITEADKEFAQICGNPAKEEMINNIEFYPSMIDCKAMFMFQHLFWQQKLQTKNEIDPFDFWMHQIFKTASGQRKVVRYRLTVITPRNRAANPMTQVSFLEAQDVSAYYKHILDLPAILVRPDSKPGKMADPEYVKVASEGIEKMLTVMIPETPEETRFGAEMFGDGVHFDFM